MDKPRIILLKGLPASGKTSWAQAQIDTNNRNLNEKIVRVNNDDLREMLNRSEFTKDNEEQIGRVRSYLVRTYLESGYSVIVDNTNLNPRHEEEMRDLASALMVDFEIKEFPVDVETCIERDKKRANPVGKSVIEDMAKRWNYYPPKPREFEPIVQDQSLPRAFVFDIDGTLAYMNGRSPYDYSRVSEDGVHQDVADMARVLARCGNSIIIVSGRRAECRQETFDWLMKNNIPFDSLHMRQPGDEKRNDKLIKYEILKKLSNDYYIRGIFDDRDRVIQMAREAGFRVYQVNYGNF